MHGWSHHQLPEKSLVTGNPEFRTLTTARSCPRLKWDRQRGPRALPPFAPSPRPETYQSHFRGLVRPSTWILSALRFLLTKYYFAGHRWEAPCFGLTRRGLCPQPTIPVQLATCCSFSMASSPHVDSHIEFPSYFSHSTAVLYSTSILLLSGSPFPLIYSHQDPEMGGSRWECREIMMGGQTERG